MAAPSESWRTDVLFSKVKEVDDIDDYLPGGLSFMESKPIRRLLRLFLVFG